ncbi:unnamed protein product [Protopolystoma xenopodis]|uniref:Uncharacterized protein n=1 Tax=Protopolystoma xenopodis TaxID=117903 RepID=A0A3S5FGI9_9PLAT|nr:unnamed protein product [Protopolystoma xenopodis]
MATFNRAAGRSCSSAHGRPGSHRHRLSPDCRHSPSGGKTSSPPSSSRPCWADFVLLGSRNFHHPPGE